MGLEIYFVGYMRLLASRNTILHLIYSSLLGSMGLEIYIAGYVRLLVSRNTVLYIVNSILLGLIAISQDTQSYW